MLQEWTIHYVRSKDASRGQIKDILENKDGWDIIVDKGDQEYYAVDENPDFKKAAKKIGDKKAFIVTSNKKKNFDNLKKSWKDLSKCKKVCVIFVNKNSTKDKKWIVCPFTHNLISDESSLNQGLKSMFETVDEIK